MTRLEITPGQRVAARIAGASCLLSIALVVAANFGIMARITVPGDVTASVRNMVAHESLFRLGIVMFVLYAAGVLVLLSALYVILRPAGRGLAVLAACFRLAYAMTWLFGAANLFTAVRIVTNAPYLGAFEAGRLQGLARLFVATNHDVYYVGLLFYALASNVTAWLWLRSRYIPRWLSVFGVAASAWCVATTMAYLVYPTFRNVVNWWWFDSPMGGFEMITSVWLLVKGLPHAVEVDEEA
jgi:hypothetical protein